MNRPLTLLLSLSAALQASAAYPEWRHSGVIHILTTPEGAMLPAGAEVENFPLFVRLRNDSFPFAQAAADGRDLRVSAAGQPLAFEIEDWDAAAGTASLWVRVPKIRGNERQEIRLHWGKPDAASASDGKLVFNESNGYLGVWHLGSQVHDATGMLDTVEQGTQPVAGMIGGARRFSGKSGVSCGKSSGTLPAGGNPHSTQAWYRADKPNGMIVGWGNEKAQGKVTMIDQSPRQIRMDCYFSSADVRAEIPGQAGDWTHVFFTYENAQSVLYINGKRSAAGNPRATPLKVEQPARLWLGGWQDRYSFAGDIDEVRVSSVARSADWVRLEYENQKPIQALVGPLVQPGTAFAVTPDHVVMNEGASVTLSAQAGGAQKVFWSKIEDGRETVLASDCFRFGYDAGRVSGDRSFKLRFGAVFADGTRSIEVPVTVKETLPDPVFALKAPAAWDGRKPIEIHPEIRNLDALRKAGAGDIDARWEVSGIATIHDEAPGRLVLHRAQGSGTMTVRLFLTNGGETVEASAKVTVREPAKDAWVRPVPAAVEMPAEGQFYARDDSGLGTIHCTGKLDAPAETVFLRVSADGSPSVEESAKPNADGSYALTAGIKPGLIKYRVEFGTRGSGGEKILHRAGDILCGDAYLIQGQSNALATDTREESPRETYEWIRSYGNPRFFKEGERENLWCKPVWKAGNPEGKEYWAETGWWGMDLAKRLVERNKVPVFVLNGAQGGTRIDQHQRNDANPTDLETIYGRMLWRLRQARLTHGIRAVIWHQGESDQGADGPDGGYGWQTYQRHFVEMSADWKRDMPNISRYYIFQIWPNACSMGGGNGDMLREVQRTLPQLYSNMEILSTLGIRPPGGCHYPLEGWSEFARMLQPLIERDFYAAQSPAPLTPPNLQQAYYTSPARNSIALEFDQAVTWDNLLAPQFYLDETNDAVIRGEVAGHTLTLTLAKPGDFRHVSYVRETTWKPDLVFTGSNGLATLSFCKVPILPTRRK